jgi:hypothetical protein
MTLKELVSLPIGEYYVSLEFNNFLSNTRLKLSIYRTIDGITGIDLFHESEKHKKVLYMFFDADDIKQALKSDKYTTLVFSFQALGNILKYKIEPERIEIIGQ